MLWSGGNLRAGAGQGLWERLGRNHFMASFKFFIFDLASGNRTGSEELTKDISLTGSDTFEATTKYDLFDAAGTRSKMPRNASSTKGQGVLSRWHTSRTTEVGR
jgi:hypothetical protein